MTTPCATTAPAPLVVVAGAVIAQGRVLATRRATGTLAGLWEFPGGKLEPGESPQECIERELMEELGITVRAESFLARNVHAYEAVSISLSLYVMTVLGGSPELREHDQSRWLAGDELHSLCWAPADIPLLEAVGRVLAAPPA